MYVQNYVIRCRAIHFYFIRDIICECYDTVISYTVPICAWRSMTKLIFAAHGLNARYKYKHNEHDWTMFQL